MGLDMYLTGKRYLSCYNEKEKEIASKIQELFPELKDMTNHVKTESVVKEISVEVGYWRKANHIHNWFVNNVQDGEDECRPHYVSRENLHELRALCKRVMAEQHFADQLLPTQSGFFFGSCVYDEYYFDQVAATIDIIDRALSLDESEWSIEYCSSW